MIRAAASLFDVSGQLSSVLQPCVNGYRVPLGRAPSIKHWIMHNLHPWQQCEDPGISQTAFRELIDEGVAIQQGHRADKVSIHLGCDYVGRLIRPANVHTS